jgi:hypothetical protein
MMITNNDNDNYNESVLVLKNKYFDILLTIAWTFIRLW